MNGTLAELIRLLPPATVEYVEKQPTLEDVFLSLVGDRPDNPDGDDGADVTTGVTGMIGGERR